MDYTEGTGHGPGPGTIYFSSTPMSTARRIMRLATGVQRDHLVATSRFAGQSLLRGFTPCTS